MADGGRRPLTLAGDPKSLTARTSVQPPRRFATAAPASRVRVAVEDFQDRGDVGLRIRVFLNITKADEKTPLSDRARGRRAVVGLERQLRTLPNRACSLAYYHQARPHRPRASTPKAQSDRSSRRKGSASN